MSWFSSQSAVNVDQLIKEATDESIPNGELNLIKALELSDFIRSKKIPAKDVMRSLKKRLLLTKNPNLQLSTLELIDFCIKNGGSHFISEISTREFLDSLNSKVIQDDDIADVVTQKALRLVQIWAKAFESSFDFKNFGNLYQTLLKQGYQFPTDIESGIEDNKIMFDSNVPPEWEDSDACMICSNAFSMINRKHHCRNCGGVFCGEHSSKFIELPELGILEPVRVCDTCYDEVKSKKKSHKKKKKKNVIKARLEYNSEEEDEDLKRALELSLKESQSNGQVIQPKPVEVKPAVSHIEEEDDEDLKAAIAASLKDLELSKQKTQQAQEPLDAYSSLLPAQSAGYQSQYQRQSSGSAPPPPLQSHPNKLSSAEETAIRQFTIKTIEAQNNPNVNAQELTDHYRNAIPLQPKLNYELNDSISRYDQLVNLNFKIDNVMRLYNQILDDKIERESYGYHKTYQQEQHAFQQPLSEQSTQQYAQPGYARPAYTSPEQQFAQPQQHQQPQYPEQHNKRQNSIPDVPQNQPQQPITEYQPQYIQQQQYTGEPAADNSTGEDPFNDSEVSSAVEAAPTQREDEFSAPLAPSEPEYEQVSNPETHTSPQYSSEPRYPPIQQDHDQQQYPHQPAPYVPSPVQIGNKITDFNFPNVPVAKLPLQQQQNQQQVQQPMISEPKEETLIEL